VNYPRVTTVLAPYCDFSKVPPDVLLMASERGTAAHEACLAYAVGLWSPVTEDIAGYVQSFKTWFDRYVTEVLAVEKELKHPKWNYIGHADLIARVKGYITAGPVIAVIDLKTPILASQTWKCQIAAYVEAEQLERLGRVIGAALQLQKDGGLPKMSWVEDQATAFNAFTGLLSGQNYLRGGK